MFEAPLMKSKQEFPQMLTLKIDYWLLNLAQRSVSYPKERLLWFLFHNHELIHSSLSK